MTELLTRYLPPRLVQALVMLVTLSLLFGPDRVSRWIEALGATAAMRILGIDAAP